MIGSFSGILVHQVGNHSSCDKRKLISERVFDCPGEIFPKTRSGNQSPTRMTPQISSFFRPAPLRGGNAETTPTAPTSPGAVCNTANGRVTSTREAVSLDAPPG